MTSPPARGSGPHHAAGHPPAAVALRSPFAGYVLGLATTGMAAVVMPGLGVRHEGDGFVILALAVFLSAGWGGLGPGVFAALLAATAAAGAFPGSGPWTLVARAALFGGAAVLGSTAPAWTEPARRRAESHARELRKLNEALVRQKVELVVQAEALQEKAHELEEFNLELAETAATAERDRQAAEKAESHARRSAALLDAFIDNAPIGFAFWDSRLRYARVNAALARMSGVSVDELLGERVGSVLPESAGPLRAVLRQVLRERRPLVDFEISGPVADEARGERHWRASYFPLEAEGEVLGAIGIIADITERHELEEQLRQAQQLEAVARVAGGIAHDFNNVLMVIKSCGRSLLEALPAQGPGREEAEQIGHAADRGSELSRQLLAFSRKQPLEPRPVALNAVIEDMERMLRRMAGEAARLETALAPELKTIRADRGQLEQVLMNLVTNARDAMPEGGTLRIATANVRLDREYADRHLDAQPGDYVLLEVSDTGVGMERELLEHIFEPFFTTKPKGKGTGLGLATVYGIVRQSGGSLAVASGPGEGTTFRLLFPVLDPPQPCAASRPAPGAPCTRHVLLVEDDIAVRALARRVLERDGYTVVEAGDGRAALHLVEREAAMPDVLVTDIIMPGMSGQELAARLRYRHPGLRVLYMSGYAQEVVAGRGALAPDAICLDKPFTPDALLHKLREILDTGA